MTDVSVCLTVDYDAISLWRMFGAAGARSLSRGEFGSAVGAPRLLELFRRHEIVTTWFVPGITAQEFPDSVAAVAAAGHEIGNHGHLHEDFGTLPLDAAREAILRANDVLQRVAGRPPVGARLPGGDLDAGCLTILAEEGFSYDSSLFGGYEPRWARTLRVDGDGRLERGDELPLVELPLDYSVSDFSYFEIGFAPPLPAVLPSPRQVEQIWCDELDDLVDRQSGGILMVAVHPQCIGRGSRLAMLERFIRHARDRGCRFAAAETLALEFRERQPA